MNRSLRIFVVSFLVLAGSVIFTNRLSAAKVSVQMKNGVYCQLENSLSKGSDSTSHSYMPFFPFNEGWEMGMFAYNDWQFTPAQLNWVINTSQGNPAPSAVFNGSPGILNYTSQMETSTIYAEPWVCAQIYLEFDYKLNDMMANGAEKLEALYYCDNAWISVFEITNQGSTGWIHQKIDISTTSGKNIKIGFKVSGANSSNFASWFVDNIKADAMCKGPSDCHYSKDGDVVHLFWQPPQCDSAQVVAGYNVYRCDGPNSTSFVKLNGPLIAGLEYSDHIPAGYPYTLFRYLIGDTQRDPWSIILCEGFCDTLEVDLAQGIHPADYEAIQIYPIPANDFIRVQSKIPIHRIELLNCTGRIVSFIPGEEQLEAFIPAGGLPNGIYMVKITNSTGTFLRKVSVVH